MLFFPPPVPGIIIRSSVWLGLPNVVEEISVANNTSIWPETFCVGSSVSAVLIAVTELNGHV